MNQINDIHESVRDHYGSLAQSAAASCCGEAEAATGCCTPADHAASLYGATSLEDLPVDVTGLSLGCGDPVTIASLEPGETVLDLGSGGGIDCFLAAKQVGPEGCVIGVDMTPEMLERANANKAKLGAQNVEFRRGQIEALPVDDASVDVVMSNCVINLSPDKGAVFNEAFRVLKPGGRISVSDIVTEGAFTDEMRADAAKWAACISGAIDIAEYTGLMRAAGFVGVEVGDKVEADGSDACCMPRVFSARITGRKPA
jgi:SAM-dependent methyltransferase